MVDIAVWDIEIEDINQNKESLLNQIKDIAENSENADLLWRTAKAEIYVSYVAILNNDIIREKQMLDSAVNHSKNAIELQPTLNGAINWYCASLGLVYRHESRLKQAEICAIVKKQVLKGLAIYPHDYHLHYTYGRWCYNVCEVSTLERKLASIVTATNINADYNMSLQNLMKANELRSNWKPIYLWIAKVYIKLNNDNEALKWLNDGLGLQTNTEDDMIAHKEINSILSEYSLRF